MKNILIFLVPLMAMVFRGDAVVLFNLDNAANTSAPNGVSLAWNATARIANYDGSSASSPSGTAVHLGHGYMLSAQHVIPRSHVSFDGVTWFERDTSFTPVQVRDGVDLQIFKLVQTPTTTEVVLHDGGGEVGLTGYSVNWGRGREFDSQIGQSIQDFGKDGTLAKRWGTNVVRAVEERSWEGLSGGGVTYTQQTLVHILGDSEGGTESAYALWDSGSPFFQEINGTMVLTGIAGTRSTQNGTVGDFKATFGNDTVTGSPFGRGDQNLLVQIGPYADEIMAIIPESSNYGLFFGLLAVALMLGLRRINV